MDELSEANPWRDKYYEAELRHIRELRTEDAKQLALQAKEYERRLQDLNGEAGRLHTVLSQTLNKEVFDKVMDSDRDWKGRADVTMAENKGKRAGVISVGAVIGWGASIVAVLVVLAAFLLRNQI